MSNGKPTAPLPTWQEDNIADQDDHRSRADRRRIKTHRPFVITLTAAVVLLVICITESVLLQQYISTQSDYEHDLDLISEELEIKTNQVKYFLQDASVYDRLGALQWDTRPANAPPIEQQYLSDFMRSKVSGTDR